MAKQDLVNWEEKMAAAAAQASAVERPALSRISMRAGVLRYMDTEVPGNQLDCVVVASAIEQVYYDQPFEAERVVSPACFALADAGTPDDALVPHPAVLEPQAAKCSECPQFEWGSGRGRGKACSTRRRLALIPADALNDKGKIGEAEVAMLSVPVTSVKHWANYVNKVAASAQRPPWCVVTRIAPQPDPKTQFKVTFEMLSAIDVAFLSEVEKLIDVGSTALMTPYDMAATSEPAAEENTKY